MALFDGQRKKKTKQKEGGEVLISGCSKNKVQL
jgi:hypothetical protein